MLPAPSVSTLVKAANLTFAGAQSVFGQTSRLTGYGTPVDQRPETFHAATPIAPAFAIWGPLFASEALYAWRVARDGSSPLHQAIAPLTALAFAGNTAWELQAELRGFEPQSNLIIAGAAVSAGAAILRAERGDFPEDEKRRVRLPIGLLAGWLIAACVANAEASRIHLLGRPPPEQEAREAIGLILTASVVAASLTYAARGSAFVAAGAGWGLAGIAVRNKREDRPRVVAAAVVGLTLTGVAVILGRQAGRAPGGDALGLFKIREVPGVRENDIAEAGDDILLCVVAA